MKKRGNPWHDARGRFCSGPSGGGRVTISPSDMERVDLNDGESYTMKQDFDTGLFQKSVTTKVSVDDGCVSVEEHASYSNGEETDRVEKFHMPYRDYAEYARITKPRKDKRGKFLSAYDGESFYVYDSSGASEDFIDRSEFENDMDGQYDDWERSYSCQYREGERGIIHVSVDCEYEPPKNKQHYESTVVETDEDIAILRMDSDGIGVYSDDTFGDRRSVIDESDPRYEELSGYLKAFEAEWKKE